ncbi:glycosyltransferase family 4 protein [Neorhodopirellula lusitana]|uniref:glycosyltransferase family 4 protein n=1 Tax=Neorhodopirellula lusitana TaxID=445327 RepID=UPI00384EFA15
MNHAGKPKRILMLLENNSFPEDRRVLLEVETLLDAGFDVTVISPTGASRKWAETVGGAHVYRYPATWELDGLWGYVWEYTYSLTMLLLISVFVFFRRGFDAVHVHTPPDMTAVIAIGYQLLGKKFVFDHHDLSPELYLARRGDNKPNAIYRVLCFFERLACQRADRLIATNETQRGIQTGRCGADPDRCVVVRNGPDESFLNEVSPQPELRREGRLVLGYVGAIGIQDGVDCMVRAIHELKNNRGRDDFIAVIVGGGPALQSLKTLADELGVKDLIQFTGMIPFQNVPSYVASFDICFTPDPSNAYNDSCTTIKMMEYMALRKPTVCFRTRENELTAGDAALYADDNDIAAFADRVIELMDDETLRESMGEIARKRIDDGLTWRHQAVRLVTLYRELL